MDHRGQAGASLLYDASTDALEGDDELLGAGSHTALGYAATRAAPSHSLTGEHGTSQRGKRQRVQNDAGLHDESANAEVLSDEFTDGFHEARADQTADEQSRPRGKGKRKGESVTSNAGYGHENNELIGSSGASAMPDAQAHTEATAIASEWATLFLQSLDESVLRACLEYLGGSEAVVAHGHGQAHSSGGAGSGSSGHGTSSGQSSSHYAPSGAGMGASGSAGTAGAGAGDRPHNHAEGDRKAAIIASLLSNFGPVEIGGALTAYLQHKEDAANDVIVLDDSDTEEERTVRATTSSSAARLPSRGTAIDVDDDVQFVGTGSAQGWSRGTGSGAGTGAGAASAAIYTVDSQDQWDYDAVQLVGSTSKSRSSIPAASVASVEAGTGDCAFCYDDGCPVLYLGLCKHTACRLCALRSIRMKLVPGANSCPCPVCEGDPKTKPAAGSDISGVGYIAEACVSYVHRWSKEEALLDEGRAEAEKVLETERPLSEEEVSRFSAIIVRAAVQAIDGTKLVTCPNHLCGESMASDATRPAKVQCPSCATGMCRVCGLDWEQSKHADQSCEATQGALGANQDAAALMGEGSEVAGTFKRCPVCGTGTEHRRGHGCHHITCAEPTCRAHWCWVCCGPFPCTRGCPGWCNPTCGCVYCRDCKYDASKKRAKPCGMCGDQNSCLACKGKDEGELVAAEKKAAKAIEKKAKRSNPTGVPRDSPPEGVTKDSYNSLRRKAGAGGAAGRPLYPPVAAGAGGILGHMAALMGGLQLQWGGAILNPAGMARGNAVARRRHDDGETASLEDSEESVDGGEFIDFRAHAAWAAPPPPRQYIRHPADPVRTGPAGPGPRGPLGPAPAVWDPLAPVPKRARGAASAGTGTGAAPAPAAAARAAAAPRTAAEERVASAVLNATSRQMMRPPTARLHRPGTGVPRGAGTAQGRGRS